MSDRDFGNIADQIGTRGPSAADGDSSRATTTDPDPTQPTERGSQTPVERARSGSSRSSRSRTETVRSDVTIGGASTVERAAQLQQADVDFTETRIGGGQTVERAAQIEQAGVDFTDTRIGGARTVERAAQIQDVDFTPTAISGARTVERAAQIDQSGVSFTGPRIEVDESDEPGRAARAFDTFTDGFQQTRPGTTAALTALSASLRTERGLPIPSTDRTLPGQRDTQAFRSRFDDPTDRIDEEIGAGVETITPGGDRGLQADDLPSIGVETALDIGMRDPGAGAVATVAGTEVGRDAAGRGVTSGLQAFNPAAIARDTALFADAGVRGLDRTIAADADEIQTGIDTGEAVGEFAVDEGPAIAASGVASDPSRLISAPVAGATVGAAGVLGGTAALRGARSGARRTATVLDDIDSRGGQRFLDDDRGQLDGAGMFRQQDGDDTITITGDDIDAGRGDPVTRVDYGPDIEAGGPLQRRRDRVTRADTGDDRSRDAAFEMSLGRQQRQPEGPAPDADLSGLTPMTRRVGDADEFGVPRDPLDTRGGLLAETAGQSDIAVGAVATGAATTDLLSELESGRMMSGLDRAAAAPSIAEGVGTGLFEDTAATVDTGVETGAGGRGDARGAPMTQLGVQTGVAAQSAAATQQTPDVASPRPIADTTASTQRTPVRPTGRTGRVRPPPRVPDLPEFDEREFEEPDIAFDFGGAVIENPTRTLDEVDADLDGLGEMEGFDAGP